MLDEQEAKRMFEVARHEVGDETYEPLSFAELDAREFLTEYCWVVFESGFRYTVVTQKFPAITTLFRSFDLESLAKMAPVERDRLPIRNKRKADGFLAGCRMIAEQGFGAFKRRLKDRGVDFLEELPGIGPVTKHHLAKNIGLRDTAKPDVWLVRCAEECGATSVDEFVSFLHGAYPSFKTHQIDTILWDYCQRFQELPQTGGLGVYSVEGAWASSEVMSAGPTLKGWTRAGGVAYTRRSAATRDEFLDHLRSWTALDASYQILYLRFPRSEDDGLLLSASDGADAVVDLGDIATSIEDGVYSSENCLVHLGPSWPRSATTEDMERFLERTGFAAVSGYASDVGWADSLAFDLLYLERLARAAIGGWVTPEAAESCRGVLESGSYGALSQSLDFRLVAAAG